MRIALVATPFIRVPPQGYGGTELFCYELAEGLTRRGHDVTLFTTADSEVSCRVRALYAAGQWPPTPEDDVNHTAWSFAEIARDGRFDVVHLNSALGIPFTRYCKTPVVHTIHHMPQEPISRLYARHPDVHYVAISERQRAIAIPLRHSRVIHHGLTPTRYPVSLRDEGYLTHVSRYAAEKGTHLAIDVAIRAGMPLRLAGRTHPQDHAYFDREVGPRLREAENVSVHGEADHTTKLSLIRGARALLCPLQWEEPFGLVAIEAMLCGTPVLGFRRGSFPEIVDQGVTGFLAEDGDVDSLARFARSLEVEGFDRAACARRARERFSATTMIGAYEDLYQTVAAGPVQHLRRVA
jgi:glycosyltransferase involved in cell wall biosynthesis